MVDAEASKWILVEAGPGTGKTAVALARVARLLCGGIPPSAILMVSFTRTAVAELRQRIEMLAQDVAAAPAVRITTLDSEAWNLGIAFGGGDAGDKLRQGFDGNIEATIELFQADDPALCEWVGRFQHVIIDEAQDLVGRRAELVFQLLDHLSEVCGVTVFVDPAQAIYGFAEEKEEDDDEQPGSPTPPFDQQLLTQFAGSFEKRCLTKLHRSSSPTLLQVFAQGRTTVLGSAAAPQRLAELRDLTTRLCRHADPADCRTDLAPDELVLFRRRSEVLLASSYLAKNGTPHRIRMAQTTLGAHAWLAALFASEPANVIDRDDLERRWQEAGASPALRGVDQEQVWRLLRRLAPSANSAALDLRSLRRQLARSRPPAELCQSEVGVCGPILGTIHASKGREANIVSLMLAPPRPRAGDLDEEVRVTYVGSTRARHELLIGKGYAGVGYRTLRRGGRVFRPVPANGKGPGWVQVELGRPGDVHELSVVAKDTLTADEARRAQDYLAAYAGQVVPLKVASESFRYLLRTDDEAEVALGALTEAVNKDIFAIAKEIDKKARRRPPNDIPFVSLIGVRALAVGDDHPQLANLHEPWATTGIFLVPVIRAMTMMFLPRYSPRGSK